MKVELPESGIYVAAVSGGVDSMALLHMLQARRVAEGDNPITIIVAHLDHGIREDSIEDRELVQFVAMAYGMPFVYDEANLGEKASEALARQRRYEFLEKVMQNSLAEGIITAHHEDDAIETAIMNIARGSGRKGLTSLGDNDKLLRPLIKVSKKDLRQYAVDNDLLWREDSTNADTKYRRNHVRHNVVAKFDPEAKRELASIIHKTRLTNTEIDHILNDLLDENVSDGKLNKHWLIDLPHNVGKEVIAAWLRKSELRDFDKKTLERLIVGAKVAKPGSKIEIVKNVKMKVAKDSLEIVR
jgi:tRNA(Ile)-lysidine synthase